MLAIGFMALIRVLKGLVVLVEGCLKPGFAFVACSQLMSVELAYCG